MINVERTKKMTPSQTLSTICEENEYEQNEEKGGEYDQMDGVAEKVQCMTLLRPETNKKGEKLSLAKYASWRQEQKAQAARLQKQLKAKCEFEQLIEEQLNRFRANYKREMVPTRLKDVSQSLMPKWAPPHELAALAWLGEWRPSAILDLLHGLVHSPSISWASSLKGSNDTERLLSQVMNEIRIEESVIDEEMAEIQATCIFHLSFAPFNNHLSHTGKMACVQAEFKKIERVITKAQQLRFKALELVVKKVLSQTDAAELLVAFVGIQDLIHQFATTQKLPKRPGTAPGRTLLQG